MKTRLLRPSFAEVDLKALDYNFNQIRKKIGPVPEIMGIVKANAYGHGSIEVSNFLQKKKKVSCFGVAILEEGIELRQNGIKLPILVLTHPSEKQLKLFFDFDIELTIADLEIAKSLNNLAEKFKKKAIVHIKIDTGMGRIGLNPKQAKNYFELIKELKNIKVKGVFTHFASSDDFDLSKANKQLDEFATIVKFGKEIFGKDLIAHAANSGAVLQMENSYFDMVRPGIIIYGYYPTTDTRKTFPIKKVMTVKSEISFIKNVPKNFSISYSALYSTTEETKIATIPYGYADGYPRLLTNKTEAIIRGQRFRIVGRICMDQVMINIGNGTQIKVGEKVTIVGKDGNSEIWFDELAGKLNNLQYELLCNVAKRIPRIYKK